MRTKGKEIYQGGYSQKRQAEKERNRLKRRHEGQGVHVTIRRAKKAGKTRYDVYTWA